MKKLRRKIILGVFLSALVVFMLTILITDVIMNIQITRRIDETTRLIINYNGILPEKNEYEKIKEEQEFRVYNYNEESPYRHRYFTVTYNSSGAVTCDLSHIKAIDDNEAGSMAGNALLTGKPTGNYEYYRFRVSDDRHMVVFMDCTEEYMAIEWLVAMLSLIALAFILMITVVFWFLSRRIVKPFEENTQMQKQFITDASHELKTPLAIISANAEVLAYKNGENEWVDNITAQVKRVSELVNELLTLNRLDEIDQITDISPVDLSTLACDIFDDFTEVFKSKNASVIREIQPDVTVNGNSAQLERLLSVLIENASKYVTENGTVRITLAQETRYTLLSVYNTCRTDPDTDYKYLFDRFYRPDASRTSSTGGHGVGLSIAKRIVTLHSGSIEAVPQEEGLSFNIKLSNKLKPGKQKGA